MWREAHTLAPAKINLHLRVGDRRPDGFHDIVSLFQMVDLYDALVVRLAGGDGEIHLTGDFDFPSSRNLVTRAVDVFRAETGLRAGLSIIVDQRIPIGGGFGGGSSDAVATLRCLRALLLPDLPLDRMDVMAASLGSDVPFFLGTAAALVEGRGERITPLRSRTDFAVAAVVPDVQIGSSEAYAALDAVAARGTAGGSDPVDAPGLAAAYAALPPSEWRFANSFDAVGMAVPAVAEARDALLSAGAGTARLTGSGSAVIAVFDDPAAARACVDRVNASGHWGLLLCPLATIPRLW